MGTENTSPQILIIDDDPKVCKDLRQTLLSWGMQAKAITDPLKAKDKLSSGLYNVALLDIVKPKKSRMDLIPETLQVCPEVKVIALTGYADKETAIEALRKGAFDFLEKPVDLQLLSHSVQRALQMQTVETEFKRAYEDLKRSRDDLLAYKSRLEKLNTQLMETNNALSVLARNIESTRRETEKEIILKIRSLIIPIIERLQQNRDLVLYRAELDMILRHLEELTSGLGNGIKIATLLSPSELRIASLVRNGLTTEEIANHLHISPTTVKTHRRNIRKKLGITKKGYSLKSYIGAKSRPWDGTEG